MTRQKRGFYVRGFHHPLRLIQQLPRLAEELRYETFPNKLYEDTPLKDPTVFSIDDSKEFKNSIFIEQHPQKVRPYYDKSAFLIYMMGWVQRLVSFAAYIIPFFLYALISRNKIPPYSIIGALIGMGGILLLSDITKKNSDIFFSLAHYFLSASYFQSVAILIEIEGTMSEGEVTVGSSKTDSVKSISHIIRSDFNVRLYAAEFLSLMKKKGGEREVLSYRKSNESLQWIDYFINEIHKMTKETLHPTGIDTNTSGFQSLMEANHIFNHLRGIRQISSRLSLNQTFQSKRIDNKCQNRKREGRNKSETNVIDCPNCFKSSSEEENACLNCGYSLEETG